MKSRELKTIHDMIVTDYTITSIGAGRYRHEFHPETTSTIYEFEANKTPLLKEGERYNIGFMTDSSGRNVVDTATISAASLTSANVSYLAAKAFSAGIEESNRAKNDERVSHKGRGYHWGKKYAWRRYGLVISKNAFYSYMEEIRHPCVPCVTRDPDLGYSNQDSVAYADAGLEKAIDDLIQSAVKVTDRYYKSPLYSKQFQIRGVAAITDKK